MAAGDNDITITVDANNRTQAAFGAAARGARTVGEATENANRAFREADRRYQEASIRLQQLYQQQQRAARQAADLARELHDVRTAAVAAGDSSEATARRIHDLAERQRQAALASAALTQRHRSQTEQVNDLARAYARAERNAQEALRASLMFGAGARLGPDGRVGGGDDGPGFFTRMLSRLPGFGGLAAQTGTGAAGAATGNPVVGTALLGGGAALLAALLPFLGGVVTGAIGGAAGAGGVGLGVAGAFRNDPKGFEQQLDGMLGRLTGRWQRASASWVLPLHDALREVDGMLRTLPIESVLQNSAGYLAPLTKGVTGFGRGLFDGLDSLVRDAAPVINMLEKQLPRFGEDLGGFFAALGKGADGGALALGDFLSILGQMTKGLGVTLSALAKMYEQVHGVASVFSNANDTFADWLAGLLDGIPILEKVSEHIRKIRGADEAEDVPAFGQRLANARPSFGPDPVTGEIEKVPRVFGAATDAIDEYLSKLDEMRDRAAGAANAQVALAQGWLDLGKELKDGKRTLDLSSQAGIDNTSALIAQAEAAEAYRQQQINLNGDVDAANATYEENIARIEQMAIKLGFNKDQVHALIEQLRVLDTSKAKPEVILQDPTTAQKWLGKTKALLDGIAGTYNVNIAVSAPAGISVGNLTHHAAGGPTSGLSAVNDWGAGTGELIRTPDGSMVIPGGSGRRLMASLANGGGGQGGQRITLEIVSDGSDHGDYIADQLAKTVRVRGGNVQLAVTGRAA